MNLADDLAAKFDEQKVDRVLQYNGSEAFEQTWKCQKRQGYFTRKLFPGITN